MPEKPLLHLAQERLAQVVHQKKSRTRATTITKTTSAAAARHPQEPNTKPLTARPRSQVTKRKGHRRSLSNILSIAVLSLANYRLGSGSALV